jgi:hypothetical protein
MFAQQSMLGQLKSHGRGACHGVMGIFCFVELPFLMLLNENVVF